jgi:putative transposase
VVGTAKKLAALMQRKLDGPQLIAMIIEGVRFAITCCWPQSASISAARSTCWGCAKERPRTPPCKALLADLIERGLPTDHRLLFAIDCAKALRRALTEIFGERALIRRCREHKKRNVAEVLPERMCRSVRGAMSEACATRDPKRARRLL